MKLLAVAGVFLVVAFIGGSLAPVIPITYAAREPYQRTEKYTENVPVEVEVPVQYQEIANRQNNLFDVASFTLEPNRHLYRTAQLPSGRDVQFSFSTSESVNVYVFSSGQYANYQQGRTNTPIVLRKDVTRDTVGLRTSASDTYYFVIENPSGGFFGLGAKNVGIYSANAISMWQEIVTNTRMEKKVELKPVEKERTVEDIRTVQKQKNVNLFEYLAGLQNSP